MRKIKNFGLINLIALVLVVIILSFIPTAVITLKKDVVEENLSIKNGYNGILELWHIDTFEGGTSSKEFYLNSVSDDFRFDHPGTYVHITNLTVQGLIEKLNQGYLPDLFSFGTGVGEYIFNYLIELNVKNNIKKCLKDSGVVDYKQYALSYTYGGYFLFSTEENLNQTGKPISEDLIHNYDKYGYTYSTRKKTITIPSISYGENEFIAPLGALYYANNKQKTGLVTDVSPYDAYVGFVGFNASTILLGNHRDLARLVQKEKMGELQGLNVSCIGRYTDLVQYIAAAKTGDDVRQNLATEYISYCLKKENQVKLSDIGMLSVIDINIYSEEEYYRDFELALTDNIIVPNAFEKPSDRINRKSLY